MSVFEYFQPMSSVFRAFIPDMGEKVSIFRYGSVIFFMWAPDDGPRNRKVLVNTLEKLRSFCTNTLGAGIETFIRDWPQWLFFMVSYFCIILYLFIVLDISSSRLIYIHVVFENNYILLYSDPWKLHINFWSRRELFQPTSR